MLEKFSPWWRIQARAGTHSSLFCLLLYPPILLPKSARIQGSLSLRERRRERGREICGFFFFSLSLFLFIYFPFLFFTFSGHEIEFLSETRGGGAIVAPFTAASCSDQLLSWFRQRRFGDTSICIRDRCGSVRRRRRGFSVRLLFSLLSRGSELGARTTTDHGCFVSVRLCHKQRRRRRQFVTIITKLRETLARPANHTP